MRWDRETLTLSGKATRPLGCTGTLFVSVPRALAITNPCDWHIARDAPIGFVLGFKVYDEKIAMEELDLR